MIDFSSKRPILAQAIECRSNTFPNGHLSKISSITQVDQHLIAVADCSNQIKVWDITLKQMRRVINYKGLPITCLQADPLNTSILMSSQQADKSLRFWDLETGTEIRRIVFKNAVSGWRLNSSDQTLILAEGNNLRMFNCSDLKQRKLGEFRGQLTQMVLNVVDQQIILQVDHADFKLVPYPKPKSSRLYLSPKQKYIKKFTSAAEKIQ